MMRTDRDNVTEAWINHVYPVNKGNMMVVQEDSK